MDASVGVVSMARGRCALTATPIVVINSAIPINFIRITSTLMTKPRGVSTVLPFPVGFLVYFANGPTRSTASLKSVSAGARLSPF